MVNHNEVRGPVVVLPVSLKPNSIRPGQTAALTVVINNVDLKTHEIKFMFKTNPKVLIYAEAEKLLPRSDSCYEYAFRLESSDPSRLKVFNTTVILEEGVLRSDYLISLFIYVDGNELAKLWNDVTLTVKAT